MASDQKYLDALCAVAQQHDGGRIARRVGGDFGVQFHGGRVGKGEPNCRRWAALGTVSYCAGPVSRDVRWP